MLPDELALPGIPRDRLCNGSEPGVVPACQIAAGRSQRAGNAGGTTGSARRSRRHGGYDGDTGNRRTSAPPRARRRQRDRHVASANRPERESPARTSLRPHRDGPPCRPQPPAPPPEKRRRLGGSSCSSARIPIKRERSRPQGRSRDRSAASWRGPGCRQNERKCMENPFGALSQVPSRAASAAIGCAMPCTMPARTARSRCCSSVE